jgi:hypothetical protein
MPWDWDIKFISVYPKKIYKFKLTDYSKLDDDAVITELVSRMKKIEHVQAGRDHIRSVQEWKIHFAHTLHLYAILEELSKRGVDWSKIDDEDEDIRTLIQKFRKNENRN